MVNLCQMDRTVHTISKHKAYETKQAYDRNSFLQIQQYSVNRTGVFLSTSYGISTNKTCLITQFSEIT